MKDLYCPFRKEHVAANPEEIVRQHLLRKMTEELGYLKSGLVVEKALVNLPFIAASLKKIPDRRVDILSTVTLKGVVKPLLLIECKAETVSAAALKQAMGYNHFIKAPFVAVASASEVITSWQDPLDNSLKYIDFLPYFQDLVEKVQ